MIPQSEAVNRIKYLMNLRAYMIDHVIPELVRQWRNTPIDFNRDDIYVTVNLNDFEGGMNLFHNPQDPMVGPMLHSIGLRIVADYDWDNDILIGIMCGDDGIVFGFDPRTAKKEVENNRISLSIAEQCVIAYITHMERELIEGRNPHVEFYYTIKDDEIRELVKNKLEGFGYTILTSPDQLCIFPEVN